MIGFIAYWLLLRILFHFVSVWQDLTRVVPYVHAHDHEEMSKPKPLPPSNSSMTSTFATILRSSTLPSQAHHQQQQQRASATLASATTLSTAMKEQKQRQWEAELDLIVPVSEPSGLVTANTSSNTTTASTSLTQQQPLTIHHSTDTLRNKVHLTVDQPTTWLQRYFLRCFAFSGQLHCIALYRKTLLLVLCKSQKQMF